MKAIIKAIVLLLLFIPVIAFHFVYEVIKLMMKLLISIVVVFIIGYMAFMKGEDWIDKLSNAVTEYKKEKKNIHRNFMDRLKELLGIDVQRRKTTHEVTIRAEWE